MKTYFSPTSLGFYHNSMINLDQMPADVVKVAAAQFKAIGAGVAQGKRVAAGEDGQPILIDPQPDDEALQAVERAWRTVELAKHEWLVTRHRDQIDLGQPTTLTAEQYGSLQIYRQQLRDWPGLGQFPLVEHRPEPPEWLGQLIAASL